MICVIGPGEPQLAPQVQLGRDEPAHENITCIHAARVVFTVDPKLGGTYLFAGAHLPAQLTGTCPLEPLLTF